MAEKGVPQPDKSVKVLQNLNSNWVLIAFKKFSLFLSIVSLVLFNIVSNNLLTKRQNSINFNIYADVSHMFFGKMRA